MADSSPLAHSPTLVASASGAADSQLVAGARAGEYIVDGFLGAGAMGEVYAGRHPVIGKRVAIKVLRHELAADLESAERFVREARAVNQIDHPNVIDVFAFGRLDDGRLYLVMDLVEGRSLRKALADGPLAVDTALLILAEIADALDAAHARGVIHRDLKPDNVMLGTGDPPSVHVLDFGIAKLVTSADGVPSTTNLTSKGTWLGTPGYMAPEQWSADGAGPASDRYALGVMAFELLSGSLPFQAASLPAMMEQHFRAPVPALSARGAVAAHATFDPVITRAMAKDPTARFASGRAMVEALRAVAVAGRAPTHGRGRRHWVPAAAGVGVLGLSIAAFLAIRGGGARAADEPAAAAASMAPRAGTVRVEITSVPGGATVIREGRAIDHTPAHLDVARGETIAFDVTLAGYRAAHHRLTVDASTTIGDQLVPINGFEGVWALPTGELRAFQRTGETIDVFKLATVRGERQFYRHFALEPADSGVTFAASEEIVDERAPDDPGCHIAHRVEYHYDPAADVLAVRRERVHVDVREGHCIRVSSELDAPMILTRVDVGGPGRETVAPVGRVDLGNRMTASDSFDNVADAKLKGGAKTSEPPPIDDAKLSALKAQLANTSKAPRKSAAKPVAKVLQNAAPADPGTNAPNARTDVGNSAPRGDAQVSAPPQPAQQQAAPIQKK